MNPPFEPYKEVSLRGQTALVTGASAGIGLATAWALAFEGVNLKLTARRADALAELKKQLQSQFKHIEVECIAGDITDSKTIESLEQADAFNTQILINNAGLALGTDRIENGVPSDWERMIDTNINAAFKVAQCSLKRMQKAHSGHIINLCSIAGHQIYEGGAVYCATKHAFVAFSKILRLENCDKNIRVSMISPGMVETEFSVVRFRGDTQRATSVYTGLTPLNAQDIAHQILFCLKQPAHVNIDEILITPVAQGSISKVHRSNV